MSPLKKQQKEYWRSLADLADEPEFRKHLEHEFAGGELPEAGSFSRRRFMQLMGASVALASGTACRWEKENILPLTRRPGGNVPGVPEHYATGMELGGFAQPLRVTSYDGRPIKVEGLKGHPMSRGGSGVFSQASVLELYDPDRSRDIISNANGEVSHTWGELVAALAPTMAEAKASGGSALRVLSEFSSSPTLQRVRQSFLQAFPQAKWYSYEPLHRDNERQGTQQAFGAAFRPLLHLQDARVVLAMDDDFLVDHPAALAHAADFAKSRKPGLDMVRLYAVESRYSCTGATADHRVAVRSGQVYGVLRAIAGELLKSSKAAAPAELAPFRDAPQGGVLGTPAMQKFIAAVAKDLLAHLGHSLITVGMGQPGHVHALAHQLNVLIQAAGHTVTYVADEDSSALGARESITALTEEMSAGSVNALVILGGNPAYNAADAGKFKSALAKVKTSYHLSLYRDETSRACTWHVPKAHYLESWGDARAYDGSVIIVQPLIAPLYNGKTPAEFVSAFLGDDQAQSRTLTKTTLTGMFGGVLGGEKQWRDALREGFVTGSAAPQVTPALRLLTATPVDGKSLEAGASNGQLELTFWADSHAYDGRFANNGWLQELPDFMTKLTWDNAAVFAPATAEALGVKHETLVRLKVGANELDVAAFILPGQAPGSVAVSLGYGRTEAGHVAGTVVGDVPSTGFDTYTLWQGRSEGFADALTVTPLGTKFKLGITQDHHSMDDLAKQETRSRAGVIIREATLEEFTKNPKFVEERSEHPPLESLWKEFEYNEGHRWAMSVDLNACTGCNACVIACQAENNVPIVGKEQVIRGREMHWIRIDRYFTGDVDAPQVATQPVLCQQCENAPCEQVCPVAATVHSHEGLNDMVYNRCIGTRYCSNNCPYKVRRFNFFNYHKNLENSRNQVAKMVYNPEVTVRARGVMEKCTYCVQRIQNVKIVARNARRPIADGEINPACAEACPSECFTFGDLNDVNSAVVKTRQDPRGYALLEELNTKPRTVYLARVRNPNPELS